MDRPQGTLTLIMYVTFGRRVVTKIFQRPLASFQKPRILFMIQNDSFKISDDRLTLNTSFSLEGVRRQCIFIKHMKSRIVWAINFDMSKYTDVSTARTLTKKTVFRKFLLLSPHHPSFIVLSILYRNYTFFISRVVFCFFLTQELTEMCTTNAKVLRYILKGDPLCNLPSNLQGMLAV